MAKKTLAVLICILTAFSLFAACGGKPAESMIIGTAMSIEKVNRNDYYWDVLTGTVSQLAPVSLNEDGSFSPLLCDYETTDSKTWTLTVRDGAKWDDGEALTSDDIKFTIEYLDEQNNGGYADFYSEINIVDEKTLELVLKKPNARFLSNLTTLRIIPKHIFEGKNMADVGESESAVGCGPYKFVSYDPQSLTAVFEAVDDFFMGKPQVKNVVYKFYDNADTLTMALANGEIDMIYYYASGIDISNAEMLKKYNDITLTTVKDTGNTSVLVFNNGKAPFDDPLIRKAVAASLDYDKFVELFGSEYSKVANTGFVPEGSIGYVETPQNKRDLDLAKQYLAEAGASDTDGDGILELNGKKLSVELLVRSDKAIYERYGELIKANLAEVGIEVKLKLTEVADFRAISEQQHTNDFMITKFTAYGMSMGSGMGSAYMDARKTSNAQAQVSDSEYYAIVDKLASSKNMEEYLAASKECQLYYEKTTPAVAIYWDSYIQAYNSRFSGFATDGTFGLLNVNTWLSIKTK